MKLRCLTCGTVRVFKATPGKMGQAGTSAVEVAAMADWWQLGDGKRGQCLECQMKEAKSKTRRSKP